MTRVKQAAKSIPGYRISLIDASPLIRYGLKHAITATAGWLVRGEAGDAHAALAMIPEARPDLVILEPKIGPADGFALMEQIRRLDPGIAFLMFSDRPDRHLVVRALSQSVNAWVAKHQPVSELLRAIRHVRRGDLYVEKTLARDLLRQLTSDPQCRGLDDGEWNLARLIGKGLSTRRIAAHLGQSPLRVEAAIVRALKKICQENTINFPLGEVRQA